MNTRTAEALAEIKNAIAQDQDKIVPAIFSHCFGRAATSAAFRMAKAQGLIVVNYMSCVGTPVYKGASK